MAELVTDTQNVIKEPEKDFKYFDFDIKISHGNGKEYQINAINSSGDTAQATMDFPFDETQLEAYLNALRFALLYSDGRSHTILSQREQAVKDFGQRLFDLLIIGEVKDLYLKSQEQTAKVTDTIFRLRLQIEETELASLPWEFLYDLHKRSYVCLTDNTSLVRYAAFPQPVQPLTLKPPLHILGMIANPNDQDPIDREHEMSLLQQALKELEKKGLVSIVWIEKQTRDKLQQYIQEAPWHIFHFVGYGRYDSQNSEGQIAFATNKDQTDWIGAIHMADLFTNCSSLRLMILDACEGARSSERDIFSSTASTLVGQGISAVLTMQYKIADDAKINFIRTFYKALVGGIPVDIAVTEARKAINQGKTNRLEPGTLALYSCLSNGVLFERLQRKRQKRRFIPKIPWGGLFRTIAFLFLIVGLIMLFLSFFTNLNFLYNVVTVCILAFGLVGTILPLVIRISPAPAISDYFNSFRRALYWFKRFVWPSPIYSRRWFLKGLAFGASSAFLVTAGLYILARELTPSSYSNEGTFPQEIPTDIPTPEPGSPIFSYHGHTASVFTVACSPSLESRQVASAGADRTVQVWNWDQATPATGKPIIIYYDHTDTVNGLAWSPDGKRIASASTDRTVKVWEVSTQNTLFTYTGHTARVNAVARVHPHRQPIVAIDSFMT